MKAGVVPFRRLSIRYRNDFCITYIFPDEEYCLRKRGKKTNYDASGDLHLSLHERRRRGLLQNQNGNIGKHQSTKEKREHRGRGESSSGTASCMGCR